MNALRILEISWLVLGMVGLILCGYNLVNEGPVAAIWPLLFTLVAGVFYTIRRKQRKAFEKQENNSVDNS
jgi:F0F1-type ATP synthase assembly protein I